MGVYLNGIAKKLAKNSEYSEDVLVFCLKLWLSTIFQSICMLVISAIFFDIGFFIAFFCVFFITRLMIEGYHCKTFAGCFILSNIIFVLICIVSKITMPYTVIKYIAFAIQLLSTVYLIYISIKNNYKKLHIHKREKVYFVLRLVWIFAVSGYIITEVLLNSFNCDVHIWVMLYSYCTVFLLTIIEERRIYYEK